MKKKLLTYTAFLLLLVLTMSCLDSMLSLKSGHGINQTRAMYDQPKNTIDVAFMGSSHIHCDVNTALLWEKYGIASYDYSAAEQPLWGTYHYLVELCKYQKPKIVVLDLFAPARFTDDYQYDFLYENIQGLKFSLNKLQLLAESLEVDRWKDYLPDFITYHDRYEELKKEDFDAAFNRMDMSSYKGYTPYFDVRAQKKPKIKEKDSGNLSWKSEKYLYKIINYARDNDIKLFFIVTPYITIDADELVYNRVHELADSQGIDFNSMNYAYDVMQLDFKKDFNDDSHLNYVGSCKFTEYMASELLWRFPDEYVDHRGDPAYSSWDEHVAEIQKVVEKAKEEGKEAVQ